MRIALLAAADAPTFSYLSPFALIDELSRLVTKKDDYSFLRREPGLGGYHDPSAMLGILRVWLFDRIEEDLSLASGLVEETSYDELITRYIEHLTAWVKGEKIKNQVTGRSEPPDETLMNDVEVLLSEEGDEVKPEEARPALLGRIAAWSIDHPGRQVSESEVTRRLVGKLRKSVLRQHQVAVADFCRSLIDNESSKSDLEATRVAAALSYLTSEVGYTEQSARDAAARLVAERYAFATPETQAGAGEAPGTAGESTS
jgi:predicted Ser/Thr protein kinase